MSNERFDVSVEDVIAANNLVARAVKIVDPGSVHREPVMDLAYNLFTTVERELWLPEGLGSAVSVSPPDTERTLGLNFGGQLTFYFKVGDVDRASYDPETNQSHCLIAWGVRGTPSYSEVHSHKDIITKDIIQDQLLRFLEVVGEETKKLEE